MKTKHKQAAFTLIKLIIVFAIIAILICLVSNFFLSLFSTLTIKVAKEDAANIKNPVAQTEKEEAAKLSSYIESNIHTIDYEGHKFIVYREVRTLNNYSIVMSMMHHPSCLCQKALGEIDVLDEQGARMIDRSMINQDNSWAY